jgi:hypothetical protein
MSQQMVDITQIQGISFPRTMKNARGQETINTSLSIIDDHFRLWVQQGMLTRIFDNRLILAPVKWKDGDRVLEVGVAGG